MMKKYFSLILMAFAIISCNGGSNDPKKPDDPSVPDKPAEKYSNYYLTKSYVGLKSGDTVQIELRLRGEKVEGATFSIADSKIAKVDAGGKITGVDDGLTELTALVGGNKVASCRIRNYPDNFVLYKNVTGDKFPVLAWGTNAPTKEAMKGVADAGFNLAYLWGGYNFDDALGLDLKLIPWSSYQDMNTFPFGQKNHPNFGMYYIYDEPALNDETQKLIKTAIENVKQKDPNHPYYINWCSPEQNEKQVLNLGLNYYSYDFYPVLDGDSVLNNYYYNQKLACEIGRTCAVPVWTFAMSVHHFVPDGNSYALPKIGHLRYEIFSGLAHGSQGFEYFTYSTPDLTDYTEAPDYHGTRTQIWYDCQTVNAELQTFAPYLLGAQSLDIMGNVFSYCQRGLTKYSDELLPYPFTRIITDGNIVVAHLIKDGQEYMLLQNADPFKANSYVLAWETGSSVKKLSGTQWVEPSGEETINAGDVILYRL